MDWKKIIQDLQNSGLTQKEIADLCNTGQSHISSLSTGARTTPGWNLGNKLIELHSKKCNKDRAA